MSYTLHFEQPHFPPDTEFGVANLGLIKNGGSIEIDEDTERMYLALYHTSLEDAFKSNAGFSLTGSSTLSDDERKSLLPEPTDEELPAGEEPAPAVEADAELEENTPQHNEGV